MVPVALLVTTDQQQTDVGAPLFFARIWLQKSRVLAEPVHAEG